LFTDNNNCNDAEELMKGIVGNSGGKGGGKGDKSSSYWTTKRNVQNIARSIRLEDDDNNDEWIDDMCSQNADQFLTSISSKKMYSPAVKSHHNSSTSTGSINPTRSIDNSSDDGSMISRTSSSPRQRQCQQQQSLPRKRTSALEERLSSRSQLLLEQQNTLSRRASAAELILNDLQKMAAKIDTIVVDEFDATSTNTNTDITTVVSHHQEEEEQRDEQEQDDEYNNNNNNSNEREHEQVSNTTTRTRTCDIGGSGSGSGGFYPDRSLWKLLSEQRWEWAQERVRMYPDEAKQMIHFPTEIGEISEESASASLVLPLHLACSFRPLPPTSLIEDIIDAYPLACQIKQMSTGLLPIHMIVDLRSPDMNRNINEFTGFNENENHVEILDLLLERYPNSIMATEIINNMIPLQVAAYTTKSENGIVTPIIASIFHLLVDKTTKASKSSFTDAETTIDNVVTTYKDRNGLTAYDWSWKNVNYYCSRCGMEEDSATTTTVTRRMPMKCNCNQAVSVTVNVIHPLLRKEICNHIQVIDAAKKEKRRGRNNDTATEAAEGTIVAEAEAAKATEATAVETATIRYESDKDFMLIPSSSPVPSPCWASSSSDVLSSTTSEQRSVAAAAPPTLLVESKKTTRSASFARIQRRLAQQQQLQQQQQCG